MPIYPDVMRKSLFAQAVKAHLTQGGDIWQHIYLRPLVERLYPVGDGGSWGVCMRLHVRVCMPVHGCAWVCGPSWMFVHVRARVPACPMTVQSSACRGCATSAPARPWPRGRAAF